METAPITVQLTGELDWERHQALAGVTEQLSKIMGQIPVDDPDVLERLEVCLSLLRHLVFSSGPAV